MHQHENDPLVPAQTPRPAGEHRAAAAEPGTHARLGSARGLTPAGVLRLQRSAGNASVSGALEEPGVTDIVGRGGGRPLEDGVRKDMETHLGTDFSDVRIHDDARAAASAKAVQAHAYTVGSDIVFGGGGYAPTSPTGQRMLAHELTHVVQQRSGPVDGTPTTGGIKISDPSDRFERAAEASAERFMAGGGVQRHADAHQHSQNPAVQCEAEDEEVQALAVQRDADEALDEEPGEG